MKLSQNFALNEMLKSSAASKYKIKNIPNTEQLEYIKKLGKDASDEQRARLNRRQSLTLLDDLEEIESPVVPDNKSAVPIQYYRQHLSLHYFPIFVLSVPQTEAPES